VALPSTNSQERFEGAERRAFRREPTKSMVLCYFDKHNWGQILDINECGMSLECACVPPVGQRIAFTFEVMGRPPGRFQEGAVDKSSTGEVLWTREIERMAGVRFVTLAEENRQRIRQCFSTENSSGSPAQQQATDAWEVTASLRNAVVPVACCSGTLSQTNSDTSEQCLELLRSDGEVHQALVPPCREEILEAPGTAWDDSFGVEAPGELKKADPAPRLTRVALIGLSSCFAVLAVAASARIIASRQAREARPVTQLSNAAAELGGTGSTASGSIGAVPRPFLVDVLGPNNQRWVLSFPQNGSENEISKVADAPYGSSIFAERSRGPTEKKQPPASVSLEPHKFMSAAPRMTAPSANSSAMDGLVAPALGVDMAVPDRATVGLLARREPPVPPERTLAVGGHVQAPRIVKSVLPKYPVANSIHASGDVIMDALIDPAGDVTEVKVISGPLLLQRAAEEALRQWKYEPARLNGRPVAVHLTVTMKFRDQ
jgi:TonB family protein